MDGWIHVAPRWLSRTINNDGQKKQNHCPRDETEIAADSFSLFTTFAGSASSACCSSVETVTQQPEPPLLRCFGFAMI